MTPTKRYVVYSVLALSLWGCTASWVGKPKTTTPADVFTQNARAFENRGEYQQALLTWKIVDRLGKAPSETTTEIQRLEKMLAKGARDHFQSGRQHFDAGRKKAAQREFLIALRHRPDHQPAYKYLKKRIRKPSQTTYKVQPGDSFTRIAAKIYNDPGKAFIIAYFNDLDPKKTLLIGTTLWLPAIDRIEPKPRTNIRIMLDRAQSAYQNNRLDETLALVQNIQKDVPDHPEARQLADAAHYAKGMELLKQNQYTAAMDQFKRVSPTHKDREQAMAETRRRIKQSALDEKLTQAQKHLRNNAWQQVLDTTESILKADPNNSQAQMLFSNASYKLGKMMLDQGKVAQAVELLNRIDPSYEDTTQLLSTARSRLKSQAETHYRSGVKHFINENLELAIRDWKRALELNPEHPKARLDIENAERLLDRLKALEKQPVKK